MKGYTNTKRAVRRGLLRKLQPCQAIVPLISESLERRLGVLELINVRLHLLVCAWCARYLKQIKLLRLLVRRRHYGVPEENDTSLGLTAEARERIARSLVKS